MTELDLSHVTANALTWVRGNGVLPLQRLLQLPHPDGLAGPRTRAALYAYQAGHGLKCDVIWGPATQMRMLAGR